MDDRQLSCALTLDVLLAQNTKLLKLKRRFKNYLLQKFHEIRMYASFILIGASVRHRKALDIR